MANRKLTTEQIEEIREKYATGCFSTRQLGKEYGVGHSTVSKVIVDLVTKFDSVEERFWSKVDTSGGEDACHIWIAGTNNSGYGTFTCNPKRKVGAHVFSYETANNVCVMPGMHVTHQCHNSRCVNPKHLRCDTPSKNQYEKVEVGRDYKGGSKPKVSELQMLEVKFLADVGIRQNDIAEFTGVSGRSVQNYLKKDATELQRTIIENEQRKVVTQ